VSAGWRGVLALLAVVVGPRAAAATSGSATVELQAGHDDNMFLASAPVAAQPLLRLGGWFYGVGPALSGGLTLGGARLDASYTADVRQADAVGRLSYQQGGLRFHLPALGPLRLNLGLSGARFDASHFSDDHFLLAGGEAGARLSFAESLRLQVRYRAEHRWLGANRASTDLLHAIEVRLPWRPTFALELGPRGSFMRVDARPAQAEAAFRRVRGGVEASLLAGPLSLVVDAWMGRHRLGAAQETHSGGRLEARVALGRHVELFVAGEVTTPLSTGATLDYARQAFTIGTALTAGGALARAPEAPRQEERPLVEPGRVRFRLRAATGAAVAVVGSWDDWQAPGRALPGTREAGLYEVWVEVPGGSHRYHFVVDGQARRPPEAPRYAPDGFGSDDGVVDVPPPPTRPAPPTRDDVALPNGPCVSCALPRSYAGQERLSR
jgi:hypothetical protein